MGRKRAPNPQRNNQFTAERNAGRTKAAPLLGVRLTEEEGADLKRFCQRHGVTPTELVRGRLGDALGAYGSVDGPVIHLIGPRLERTLCGVQPVALPPAHQWARDAKDVTCPRCVGLYLAGRRE